MGNRLSSHLNQDYTYKPFNKLWSTDSASYQYDNNGNLLFKVDGDGETSFTWNEENQLTRVDRPDGDIILYTYDALGRRIQHTTRNSRVDERYVYDGADVLLDLNEDWSVAISYLNGPGVDNHLRQTNATSGVSYFLTDHLGSTAALANSNGDLVEEFTYDSFGNATSTDVGNPGQGIGIGGIATSTNSRTRYSYTGREFDADTGLYYYRARWYDPQVGRFISEDPIGFGGGDINLYGYVWQNPTNFKDSLGLDGWGNDKADSLDADINFASQYWRYDDQEWFANGINNTIADLSHGVADILRVGSGIGHAIYDPDENKYGRAADIAMDITRAAAIFELIGGPAARLSSPGAPIEFDGVCECHASTPVGRKGSPLSVGSEGQPPVSSPGSIAGRNYSGHAFERMQGRGIPPSAVEDTIQYGKCSTGKRIGTTAHYDPVNNITVVTNSSGGVVTVRYGH